MKIIISGVELLRLDWSEISVITVDSPVDPSGRTVVEVRDYAGFGHVDRDGDEYESLTLFAREGDALT